MRKGVLVLGFVMRFLPSFAALSLLTSCVPSGDGPSTQRKPEAKTWVESPGVLRSVFEDHFDRVELGDAGGDAAPSDGLGPDWLSTAAPGVWRVRSGKLCGKGARNHGVWLKKPIPANARIEFDAISDSPEGDIKMEAWGDGRSFARGNSYTNATSYVVLYGAWQNTKHGIARIDEHGKDTSFVPVDPSSGDKKNLAVARGQNYHIRVERTDGRTVRLFVDDTLIANFVDATPLMGIGHDHVGFNDWEAPVCFDNLQITPLPR